MLIFSHLLILVSLTLAFTNSTENKPKIQVPLEIPMGQLLNNEIPENWKMLFKAVKDGNITVIENALRAGYNPHTYWSNKMTLMHEAARNGNIAVFNLLLAYGDNASKSGGFNLGPIDLAVSNGHTPFTRILLEHGANPNSHPRMGFNEPIFEATSANNYEMVVLLLEFGGSPDAQDQEGTRYALHVAAEKGYTAIVELLLSAGADPRVKTSSMFTVYDENGKAKKYETKTPLDLAANDEIKKLIHAALSKIQ